MSAVLGIDVSSFAIDLVKLDETTNEATWERLPLTGKTAFDRLRQVHVQMHSDAWYDDCYLAAIERPKTRSFVSASALWPVFGAVVALLPPGLLVWDVPPTAWRQELGLPGNASKDECATAVDLLRGDLAPCPTTTGCDCDGECDKWLTWREWPQDAFDAYAVAYYARENNRRAIEAA